MANSKKNPAENGDGDFASKPRSRAYAICRGWLHDVGAMGFAVGFRWPVAVSAAVWLECVEWNSEDSERQIEQTQKGRLYDVLWAASAAVREYAPSGNRMTFEVKRIPRDGSSTEPEPIELMVRAHPGDRDEPVLTISLPLPNRPA